MQASVRRAESSTSPATCSTRSKIHECDYNWKTFIEVYLEDYHVGPFHPGLGNFVSCDDLAGSSASHTLGADRGRAKPRWRSPGSPVSTARWHEQVLRLPRRPKRPRLWRDLADLLPAHHGRVVSACAGGLDALFPQGPQKTTNLVEFYYPEEIVAFERDFVEAHQAAYMETCVEDDEIALRMDAGRKAF